MLYLNQLKYGHIPYQHNMKNGGPPPGRANVGTSGCGPCSLCMVVENLTCGHLDLEECVRMSERLKANMELGTDLKILAPAVAEKCGLEYSFTDEKEVLADHLRRGGMAVANSSGDRDGYIGVFTHGGHYVAVNSIDGDEVCILDPSYKEGKFEEEGRKGKVLVDEPFVYCSLETLWEDCAGRSPRFYLFRRKRPEGVKKEGQGA